MLKDIFKRENVIQSKDPLFVQGYLCMNYKMYDKRDFYHYTDINGFIGIIENKEFWLSHIKYMNDSAEYVDGKNICEKVIKEMLATVTASESEILTQLLASINNEQSLGFFTMSGKDIFSLSFTKERDSLDMWRGYGNHSGIAIGFDYKKCDSTPGIGLIRKAEYDANVGNLNSSDPKILFLINIIYDDEIKKNIFRDIINIGLEIFKTENNQAIALEFLSGSLFRLFPFMKNKGFKNEQECRIIDNEYSMLDESDPYEISFRERNGIILPFTKYKIVDTNCKPISQWPIKEIIIGPGLRQKDLAESVKYFLTVKGFPELAYKVIFSDIPYISTM